MLRPAILLASRLPHQLIDSRHSQFLAGWQPVQKDYRISAGHDGQAFFFGKARRRRPLMGYRLATKAVIRPSRPPTSPQNAAQICGSYPCPFRASFASSPNMAPIATPPRKPLKAQSFLGSRFFWLLVTAALIGNAGGLQEFRRLLDFFLLGRRRFKTGAFG